MFTIHNHEQQILRLYGFAFVTVTGDMPPAKRAAMLKQFARGGRDGARLLILSAVGLVGVNLAIACILIIVVSHLKII